MRRRRVCNRGRFSGQNEPSSARGTGTVAAVTATVSPFVVCDVAAAVAALAAVSSVWVPAGTPAAGWHWSAGLVSTSPLQVNEDKLVSERVDQFRTNSQFEKRRMTHVSNLITRNGADDLSCPGQCISCNELPVRPSSCVAGTSSCCSCQCTCCTIPVNAFITPSTS